jgi:hypothetical protein
LKIIASKYEVVSNVKITDSGRNVENVRLGYLFKQDRVVYLFSPHSIKFAAALSIKKKLSILLQKRTFNSDKIKQKHKKQDIIII